MATLPPDAVDLVVAPFHRSLDQELVALVRGVSLECPVCGEFVMHVAAAIVCPECGLELRDELGAVAGLPAAQLPLRMRARISL